jgi:ketosteroid isomerase-like protein
METTQRNSDFVRNGLEAGVGGDVDAFMAVLDPDVQVHEPTYLPYGGVHRGHEAVRGMLRQAGRIIDFPSLEFVSVVSEDDRIVMLMTVNLRSDGSRRHIIEHWEMRDGLAQEVRVFWDALP